MATFSRSFTSDEIQELPEIRERSVSSWKTRVVPVENTHIPRELQASLCGEERPVESRSQRKERGGMNGAWSQRNSQQSFSLRDSKQNGQGSGKGAGRDVSFMNDSMATQNKRILLPPMIGQTKEGTIAENLIPVEYHVVKQQGVPVPELCGHRSTIEVQDDHHPLILFPSLRPSSRWEVVKLIQVMDDMMEKTGIHQQTEDLTDISQMGALLELLKVEQNIYNIVFHELIRQVSVNCAERGLLLDRIRQQYVCLLERVPRQLKGLHAASLAERALNHILTQEVVCFKTCIQHLNTELAEIKTHDESLSQQAEQAQQNLAEALDQATKNADLLREYHELYELQRRRLQSQMETLAEERDLWRADTFSLAAKVISLGKLKQFHRLHVSAESWCKTAQQYATFISIKDTEQMNIIVQLSDSWREQLACFMERLRDTERAQCKLIQTVLQGITKRLDICTATNRSAAPKYEEEEIYSELMQWTNTLTVQCERYSGEQMLSCQDSLKDLVDLEDSWVEVALCVFRRHPGLDGEPPRGQKAMRKQGRVVSELHQQLETRVNGENGIHKLTMSLVSPMEAWANKMRTAIGQSDTMQASDWLKLEKALFHWQSIADEILQLVSCSQSEYERTQEKLHVDVKTADVLDSLRDFVASQSRFLNNENSSLYDSISSLHTSLIRWTVALLITLVPDHDQDPQDSSLTEVGHLDPLERDARELVQKLERLSQNISRSCQLIVNEELQKNVYADSQMYEHQRFQQECSDWIETCRVLLLDVKRGPVELSISPPRPSSNYPDSAPNHTDPASDQYDPASHPPNSASQQLPEPDSNMAHPDYKRCCPAPNPPSSFSKPLLSDPELLLSTALSHHSLEEPPRYEEQEEEEGPEEGSVSVVKMIGYDGNITERTLAESDAQRDTTEGDSSQKDSLSTMDLLQRELHAYVVQLQLCEQRAVTAEEALQEARLRILHLESQLHDKISMEPAVDTEADQQERADSACTEEDMVPELTPAAPKKTSSRTKPTKRSKRH
ncbi:axonemal dynein light chain domain-containing protein 1 isoform X1 [Gadus macrocephalus]|uniref:axonemal dynein light chain domain-containing protein 1 isoform X1 n=3 Tax=Gadus macrocephalus TaxID=80720 RepID=UPI0028CB15C7|nr:axonemal dynein light chain domain-containing protein 1 isoform X1 [Gadus macrocephalus]